MLLNLYFFNSFGGAYTDIKIRFLFCSFVSNFEISKSGKIIIGEMYNPFIRVLHPVNFREIYMRNINVKGKYTFFHFYIERPNLIYYGVRNDDSTRIKLIFLDQEDKKYIN